MHAEQLGLGFSDLEPVLASTPKPVSKGKKRTAPAAISPEEMAQALEQHPDYKVLRRLQPRLHWGEISADAVRAHALRQVVILDTETTGLDTANDRIIELAMLRVAVDMRTGLPVGDVQVYDGLEDPDIPITEAVTSITGIRAEDVQGQQLDEARIANLLDGADVVIAHNAAFDRPFVERRLPPFAQVNWACSLADVDWKASGLKSARLEDLAAHHGWFYAAHRAEVDCHALLAVLAATSLTENTALQHVLERCHTRYLTVYALQAPFTAKDTLRQAGYRWNADERCWTVNITSDALDATLHWLKTNVYSASVQVGVLEQSAQERFTTRSSGMRKLWL
ncbi:DNA polymerase III subunit epsilon [Curvibacter sp. CHRR-16]|uniref:3'-5' exonuclease n=1 Tax=Curvibacter sp. CHRR-16 TaxID=2835872 RepID=UPI001BDAD6DE|nr:3'-5' exonuclease [Curvibacter sp. CHRR-16]MBT0571201.1 DNA polymerase III subunit epsilon [Curvibacter sp. CHRR-16]